MSAAPAGNVTPIRGAEAETPSAPRRRRRQAPLGPAPSWLSAPAKVLWRSVVPELDELYPELIGKLDVHAIGLMVEHLAIAQAAAEGMRAKGNVPDTVDVDKVHGGGSKKPPASQVMRDHGKAFLELARDYGLTLGARARLDLERLAPVVPDSDDDDDLFD